ncbi:PIN domain-containing protein [Wielerella bovis]|uniref:PIN domain-containing protein n=1 Tax=Wielerella bovis TaxID=2917790 RepID=UPI002018B88E|nr:PIN domain-containing protein [Wielerella bovis]ULJ60415.1 PIN domain-containing protein [Wielerella bovis]
MNGIKYLLDTCFILEFHKQNADVLAILQQKNIRFSECAISVVNRLEVLGYANISENDARNLTILLSKMTKLPINLPIENKVIDLRKQHKIKLPDAIVLATALSHDLELLSLDVGLLNKFNHEINPQ